MTTDSLILAIGLLIIIVIVGYGQWLEWDERRRDRRLDDREAWGRILDGWDR